jgi:O-antigen/teichoic acid export membrane protein
MIVNVGRGGRPRAGRADAAAAATPAVDHGASSGATAIVRASLVNLTARVASGAAALALAVLTTNVLSTHDRGIYVIVSTWVGIAMTMITGGTPVLAADLIHRRHTEGVLHGASFAIGAYAFLLLGPVSLAVAVATDGVTLVALVCGAAVSALVTYSNFEMAIAQARGDVLRVSLTDISMALFPLVAAGVVAAVFTPTVTSLMVAWAAGALVTAIAQLVGPLSAAGLAVRPAWRVGSGVVRRSIDVALANGVGLLYARIDILVVAAILSASAAGVYSIPVALATGLLLLSRSLLTATYHSIMTVPMSAVAARLGASIRHSIIVILVAGGLSVPVVAVTAGFVFGDAYADIWRPYAILVLASACTGVHEPLRHFLLTRLERRRAFLWIQAAMVVVNGVLAVVGASLFGLLGAAASTAITYACDAMALLAVGAGALGVSKRELVIPRRSDLRSYWDVARALARRTRAARSAAR